MGRQEERHQHHRQERAGKKEERKEHEHEAERQPGLHPGWIWALGLILMLIATLTWTFLIYPRFIAPI
jgi:hypothetical protein